jgi:hypothetical protein
VAAGHGRRTNEALEGLQPTRGSVAFTSGAVLPIPFSVVTASSGKLSSIEVRFSRRCATEDVPGIRRMLCALRSNQASATCIGVASRRVATLDKMDDCRGLKPPSGKYGT